MIFELVNDFAAALEAMPPEHPRRRILALLDEAIRRDVHFIDRHPTTLFQCLWNSCWWYDCPEAAGYYAPPEKGLSPPGWERPPPWEQPGLKLCELLKVWHEVATADRPSFPWLRSVRAPATPLGTTVRAVLRGHNDWIYGLTYSPDGRRIASGSKDKTVRIWDAEAGKELFCLRGHDEDARSVAYSPDGRWIASGSKDKSVRIWDAETGQERLCLRGHQGEVKAVAFSPDGRSVASDSSDKTVRLWDADIGQLKHVLQSHRGIYCVAFSPDGRRLVSGSAGPPIQVWDAVSGKELQSLYEKITEEMLLAHGSNVLCVAYSPDCKRIISGGQNGDIRLWNAETGDEELVRNSYSGAVRSVAIAPDGQRIAFGTEHLWGSNEKGSLCICDAEGAQPVFRLGRYEGILAVAWSPDGRRLVVGGRALDFAATVVNSESPSEPPPRLHGHASRINSIACSPDGRWIATASDESMVRIWDTETGQERSCLRGHQCGVSSVMFSPDSRRIASTGRWDERVRIWDAETGQELLNLFDYYRLVKVAFSPDGARLAVAGPDRISVYVWDAKTGYRVDESYYQNQDVPEIAAWFGNPTPATTRTARNWVWETSRQTQEAAVRSASTGQVVAWFPVAFTDAGHITSDSLRHAWAGSLRNDLYVVKLECDSEAGNT